MPTPPVIALRRRTNFATFCSIGNGGAPSQLPVGLGHRAPLNNAPMLLMPVSLVKKVVAELADSIATIENVDNVAIRLRAHRCEVISHLISLGFFDESDRQRIKSELPPVA